MAPSHDITSIGRRLLPHIIDERAKAGYKRPYALYPRTKDPADGFKAISYARLANAINRASWWLEKELPRAEEKQHAFAYLGANDLRYVVFVLATIKTGRKILITSLRNTVDAQISLFERVGCKVVVSCSSLAQNLEPLFAATQNVRKIQAPSLEDLLDEELVPPYAYNKTFEDVADEKFLFIHTSGSSGNPRPISWNTRFIGATDAGNSLPPSRETSLTVEFTKHQNLLMLLPCFHAGGLCFNFYPAFYEMTIVLGHPDVPMSADYISQLLRQDGISAMLTSPSMLEDLSTDKLALEGLKRLKHIGYGGGPLQPSVGNALAPVLKHLFSFIGATEIGWFYCKSGDNTHWDSLNFYPNIGYRFEEVSDGVFELVIIKNSKTDKYHGIFETFPTLHEYRTRDLYAPSTPGWWRYQGRADDLIVLSNGEKINPIPMENILRTHAKVRAAVVVGEYRFNPSLLIEMEDGSTPYTSEERREALNEIWPLVQEANRIAPAFAKVPKSLVLFTTPGKPFLRAGKGTVQRQNTVKAYSNELSEIYSSQEADLLTEGLTLSTPISPGIIKTFTREIYWQVMGMKDVKYPTNLVDSDNVFEAGMDSLGAMIIVQRLRAALKLCGAPVNLNAIDSRLVYSAPTIGQISEAIITLLKSSDYLEKESGTATRSVRQQKMQGVLQKYSRDIPNLRESAQKPHQQLSGNALPNKAWKVILTGSTGSLGSYLLAALEARPNSQVDKIFCLNRSPHSEERQKRASSSRGLNSVWSDGRVEFLQANLSQPDLGLIPEKYSELIDEATIIIHSAWRVDFNLTIESFEPQIHGVRNLLELSSKSQRRPPLVFISSISTAFSWLEKHSGAKVPKATLHDFNAPEEVGYSESKFVSELLVERFAKESGITTAIFRTGQIAGSLFKKGSWNKQEWFPSIVASSKHLNVLPRTLGSMETIDWIPVDLLSTIMVELIGQLLHKNSTDGEAHVYNLVNPKATSWSNLLPEFQGLSGIKQTLPFKDWVWELEKSAVENRGNFTERNPAVKLLDFFRHSSQKGAPSEVESRFEVGNLIRDSRQAAELKTVSSEWMKLWMDQWGF